jgi:hypothetical protein
MRLYEISANDYARERALKSVEKQFGTFKRERSAAEIKDREAGARYHAKQKQVYSDLVPLAAQSDSYDEFLSLAKNSMRDEDLQYVDLPSLFKANNPAELDNVSAAWADYGKQRSAGKTQGRGTGGLNNWTGD